MKRLIAVLLISCFVFTSASAGAPDLSGLTYEQLIALQHYITAEITGRPEWKELTIPAGEWVVGVDIPAGEYSISPVGDGAHLRIYDKNGSAVRTGGIHEESDSIGKIRLREDYKVVISDGQLLFAPAVVLGF